MDMDKRMTAIRSFLGDERIQVLGSRKQGEKMIKPGTQFLTSPGYGKQLEARNLAVFVTKNAVAKPTENKPAGPSETKVVSPNEGKDDNKNVSQNASQNATQETKDPNIDLSEYPKHLGFGKYEMPDGSVIRGKEAAMEAMKKFLSPENEDEVNEDGDSVDEKTEDFPTNEKDGQSDEPQQ